MKKMIILGLLAVLLTGCGGEKSYETVTDGFIEPPQGTKMEIMLQLPDEAAEQTAGMDGSSRVYFCQDYILTLQTLQGGDLQNTVQQTSGFLPEALSIIETEQNGVKRYNFVFTCLGENGNEVARCAILDDGSYHYVLTAMADETVAGKLGEGAWNTIFQSFRLISPDDKVSSGS